MISCGETTQQIIIKLIDNIRFFLSTSADLIPEHQLSNENLPLPVANMKMEQLSVGITIFEPVDT
jgi:hypothetical protein